MLAPERRLALQAALVELARRWTTELGCRPDDIERRSAKKITAATR